MGRKTHHSLRTSPAQAADVTNRLWSVADLIALWESYEKTTTYQSGVAGGRMAESKRLRGVQAPRASAYPQVAASKTPT